MAFVPAHPVRALPRTQNRCVRALARRLRFK